MAYKRDESNSKNNKTPKILEKPASTSAPDGITTLGVSPIKTIKGPSIHNDKPVGPKNAAYYDGTTADQSSGTDDDPKRVW